MNAKNTSAAPAKIPPTPNAPGEIPMSCASVVPELPPGAGFEPDGGMNGCRFFEWKYDRPATMTSRMIESLIATITAFTVLDVRIPRHSSPAISSTITAANTLWWSPYIQVGTWRFHGEELSTTLKYCDQPEATVAAPSASSSIRSQPMIQATSSPRLA